MKKTILSGIQPTGRLTLGNYLGAINSWLHLQDDNENDLFIFIANLHALTLLKDKEKLQQDTKDLILTLIACGIDLKKTTFFIQSDIPAHCELSYILACESYIGELSRMHQFKEKKGNASVPTGILIYPTLMAADILLYQPDIVPVGEDQKQHVELCRNLAIRINNRFQKQIFKIPDTFLPQVGAKIMSLANPGKKMSKSDQFGDKAVIYLDDSDEAIRKKIATAVTDSDNKIVFDEVNKPGVSNLLTIYSALNNISISESEKLFANKSYREFKEAVGASLIATIAPIRNKKAGLNWDEIKIDLQNNADKVNKQANKKIAEIKTAFGLNV